MARQSAALVLLRPAPPSVEVRRRGPAGRSASAAGTAVESGGQALLARIQYWRVSTSTSHWRLHALLTFGPQSSWTARVQVLLVQRVRTASFMPGALVFPGGAQDPADGDLRVTALREAFEEAGVIDHAAEKALGSTAAVRAARAAVRADAKAFSGALLGTVRPARAPPTSDFE